MHRKHPEKRAACEPGSCTCKACCAANMTAHACRACVVAEGCVKVEDAPSRAGRPSDPDPAARPRACWPADGSAFDGGEAYWLNLADVEAERFNQPQFIHIAKTGGSAMRRCVPKARRPSGGSKARPDHVCSSDWHVPLRAYDASWRARTMADWPTFCVVRRRSRVFRVDLFPGIRRSPAGTPTSGSCRSSATRSTTCGAAASSGTARDRRLLSLFFLRAGTRVVSLDYFSTDAERQAAGPDFERGLMLNATALEAWRARGVASVARPPRIPAAQGRPEAREAGAAHKRDDDEAAAAHPPDVQRERRRPAQRPVAVTIFERF